jgi:N-acetylglucosaminyl-diphospho-decaprenol L-rhamnosyltransferase
VKPSGCATLLRVADRGLQAAIDVVVVSYNSADSLRRCVGPLMADADLRVFVVDSASVDGSLETLEGLNAVRIPLDANRGFAYGCNRGWRAGSAPYVLFLNPDAVLQPADVRVLAAVLEREPETGAVGPRLVNDRHGLEYSQRRFPKLRSTYAQALFLHRIFPESTWADELIRNRDAYDRPGSPDWISGACILIRRAVLERLGGWDESFFLYSEDTDICLRIRDIGFEVHYTPNATAIHVGGGSGARTTLLPVLAASRLHFVRKHSKQPSTALLRIGMVLSELTHAAAGRGGRAARAGHLRGAYVLLTANSGGAVPASR